VILVLLTLQAWAGDYEVHKSQADLHAKRGYWSDALDELALAMATPEGRVDPELSWTAAQVCWELGQVEPAMEMARLTARLASSDGVREQAEAWVTSLEETFGFLTIDGPYPGMSSRLQLEGTSTLFDPELKKYLNKVSLSLRSSTDFPTRIGLPVGDYLVNGQRVSIAAGGEATLDLPLRALGSRGMAAVQVARLEILGGVTAPLDRDDNALPSPLFEVGISEPVGSWVVGVFTSVVAEAYEGGGGIRRSWAGPSIGARVAREIVLEGPLSIRPGLVARAGFLPGIPYGCEGSGDAWTCVPAATAPEASHALFATARVVGVGGDVLVEYRQAGRTTSVGTGVRIGGEELLGTVPSQAQVALEDGESVTWTAVDRHVERTAFRMLGQVSIVF
jgi:hypothetical protein